MYVTKMKSFVLIISSLLLMLLAPMDKLVGEDCAAMLTDGCLTEKYEQTNFVDYVQSDDILYDQDAVTLLTTYQCGNDDIVPCRINQWGQQLRTFASRLQFRHHSMLLQVKKMTHFLSVYLTTLINHISQYYSSLHSLCWQYAADCYVFAFRQIII